MILAYRKLQKKLIPTILARNRVCCRVTPVASEIRLSRKKPILPIGATLLLTFLTMLSGAQQAPTDAAGILARYRDAVGGTDKSGTVMSLVRRGEISGDLATSPLPYHPPRAHADRGAFEFYYKAPNLWVSLTRVGDSVMYARGCDGKVAWYANPYQGRGILKPKPGEHYDCDPGYELFPSILREPGVRIQFKGTKKIAGQETYVIHLEDPKSHRKEIDYFDTTSYLLVRSDIVGWSTLTRSYSDYRDVGGIKFPFLIVQEAENSKIITTLRQVEINVPIADSVFEQPSEQKPPQSSPGANKSPGTSEPQFAEALRLRPAAQLPIPVIQPPNSTLASNESANMSHSPQPVIYVNSINFSSCAMPELLRAVPELHDLETGHIDDLNSLLNKVGAKITEMYRKTPNLIAHEDVLETEPNHPPTHRHFSYIILSHPNKDVVTLEEFRMDPQGGALEGSELTQKPSAAALSELRTRSLKASAREPGALPLAQGFANMWTNFYPNNRALSVFRYLGRQKIDHHQTLVVAFSQKPEMVLMPGKLQYQDKVVSLFFQGIAWVDEADFRIVRLRTDLLSSPVGVPLYQLTAEINFMDMPVGGLGMLWLPHQVEITSDLNSLMLKDRHTYSDYRLFGVKSRIKLDP